jgi:hypothetical protein
MNQKNDTSIPIRIPKAELTDMSQKQTMGTPTTTHDPGKQNRRNADGDENDPRRNRANETPRREGKRI